MILCLCPLSPELQALAKSLEDLGFTATRPDPLDHQLLWFAELNLYLGKAGMGSARFQKNAAWYLEKLKPKMLICAGAAGALTPDIEIGTVFSSKTSSQIFCSDTVVGSAEEAIKLHEESGCSVVAMEGRGALDAANRFGIPFIELRTITDNIVANPDTDVRTAFETNLPVAAANLAAALVSVCRK